MAAKADAVADLGAFEFPGVALAEPELGLFDLAAADKALPEQAVLVADAVAMRRAADGRQAFEETGGKPAKAAIAQRRIRLVCQHVVVILGELGQRRFRLLDQFEIDDAILEQAPDEKFHRQVIDPLGAGLIGLVSGLEPRIDNAVAHRVTQRHAPVFENGVLGILAEGIGQMAQDRVAQGGRGKLQHGLLARSIGSEVLLSGVSCYQ